MEEGSLDTGPRSGGSVEPRHLLRYFTGYVGAWGSSGSQLVVALGRQGLDPAFCCLKEKQSS